MYPLGATARSFFALAFKENAQISLNHIKTHYYVGNNPLKFQIFILILQHPIFQDPPMNLACVSKYFDFSFPLSAAQHIFFNKSIASLTHTTLRLEHMRQITHTDQCI